MGKLRSDRSMTKEQYEVVMEASGMEDLAKMFEIAAMQSVYRECVRDNSFVFYEGEHDWYAYWTVDWSAAHVMGRKRVFDIYISTGEHTLNSMLNSPQIFGKPTAEQVVNLLLRAMVELHIKLTMVVRNMVKTHWSNRFKFSETKS